MSISLSMRSSKRERVLAAARRSIQARHLQMSQDAGRLPDLAVIVLVVVMSISCMGRIGLVKCDTCDVRHSLSAAWAA